MISKPRGRDRMVWMLICLAAAAMSGCSQYNLIEPKRYAITDVYSIEPQIPWSASRSGKLEIWTVDGQALQKIIFVKGLEDGESIFPSRGRRSQRRRTEPPKFKAYMRANEVLEFVLDSWRYMGRGQVKSKKLSPTRFGKAPGYHFEYSYLTKSGLEMEGMGVGAVLDDKLYLIVYEGTNQYYFGKHKPDVEKLIESVDLL